MARKFKLEIDTPHGIFTRSATRPYMFAVVRTSARAAKDFANFNAADPTTEEGKRTIRWGKQGVSGRWIKDRGFAVTWHSDERTARNAARKPYMWDVSGCGPAEIYEVFEQDTSGPTDDGQAPRDEWSSL